MPQRMWNEKLLSPQAPVNMGKEKAVDVFVIYFLSKVRIPMIVFWSAGGYLS